MKLAGQQVTLYLGEAGEALFRKAAHGHIVGPVVVVEVAETDDLGIWVRARLGSPEWVLLLRWEFILGVEVQEAKYRVRSFG
jgi:hypothetical protein